MSVRVRAGRHPLVLPSPDFFGPQPNIATSTLFNKPFTLHIATPIHLIASMRVDIIILHL